MNSREKILVVGAGIYQCKAIIHLRRLGFSVFSIDGNRIAPGFQYSKDFMVCDITDHLKIIEAATKFKVNGITSYGTDVPIVAIANAAEKLSLPSIGVEQANLSVNKLLQRNLLNKTGISKIDYRVFSKVNDAYQIAKSMNFPIVIKPTDSSGSRGVRYIGNFKNINKNVLSDTLSKSRRGLGIIETFINGKEIAVDGFILAGNPTILSVCEKQRSDKPFLLDTELKFPLKCSQFEKGEVIKLVNTILAQTQIQYSPFHMEIILSDNGPFLVEFGARGPGFNVFETILPMITGVDTIHEQAKIALGRPSQKIKPSKKRSAVLSFIFSEHDGILNSICEEATISSIPGITECKIFSKPGERVRKLKSGSDRIGYFLTVKDKLTECEKIASQAKKSITMDVIKDEYKV